LKIVKIIYILLFFLATTSSAIAQVNDDVILRAMKDELDRSMKELAMEKFDKPFYIAYSLDDRDFYTIMAQMGSLVRTSHSPSRSSNVRLLVGDYSFNDESMDGSTGGGSEGNDVPLPIDNDYYGIRRSFWAMTDYVYKGAARQYKQNQQTLADKKKPLQEVPHRTFAKLPPVSVVEASKPFSMDLKKMEAYVTSISAEFLNFPDLENSMVYVYIASGNKYFVNSEGTFSRVPVQIASMYSTASFKTSQGETLNEELVYYAFTPNEFPTIEVLKKDISTMYNRLKAKANRGLLAEDYDGPVLFTGNAVGDLFSQVFSNEETLFASDVLPNPKKRYYAEESSQDSKLNKPVLHESLTVKAKASLKEFKGVPLLGSYSIDEDGVVPPEEIVLIENGILKGLLNDRTLLKPYETANGHRDGLSVLEITSNKAVTMQALKQKLIEKAKADQLPYVLMVGVPEHGDGSVKVVTRINVKDGSEEVIRGANLSFFSLKELKKIGGATIEMEAGNFSSQEKSFFSILAPQGLLVNDVEVKKTNPSFLKEEEYVTNPLLE
jgi:hypothetical protein